MDPEDINLSLDEIIKKKNIKVPVNGPGRSFYRGSGFRGAGYRGAGFRGAGYRGGGRGRFARGRGRGENYHASTYHYDARNTIATIIRTKTVDAREKLTEILNSLEHDDLQRQQSRRDHQGQAYQGISGYVSKSYDRYKHPLSALSYNSHEVSKPAPKDLQYDTGSTVPVNSGKPVERIWYTTDAPKYVPQSIKSYESYPKPTYNPTVIDMEVDEDPDNCTNSTSRKEIPKPPAMDWFNAIKPPSFPFPPPSFSTSVNNEPDPFDHYHVMTRPPTPAYVPTPINKPAPIIKPVSILKPAPIIKPAPLRGILRTSQASKPATVTSERVVEEVRSYNTELSQSMRNRLENAPNPSESMGIFAKMPSDGYNGAARPPSPPTMVYRIIVSNLHVNVTQDDIEELFDEINNMIEARLVRPGVAEVIYDTLKDAEEAVETYHNRYLDGQPMKCLLVNPRQSYKPTKP